MLQRRQLGRVALFSFYSSYLSSTRHPRTFLFLSICLAQQNADVIGKPNSLNQGGRPLNYVQDEWGAFIYLAFRYAIALFNQECRGSASKQRKEERERAQAFPHRTAITAGLPTLKASLVTGTTTAVTACCPRRVMPCKDSLRAAQHGLRFDETPLRKRLSRAIDGRVYRQMLYACCAKVPLNDWRL